MAWFPQKCWFFKLFQGNKICCFPKIIALFWYFDSYCELPDAGEWWLLLQVFLLPWNLHGVFKQQSFLVSVRFFSSTHPSSLRKLWILHEPTLLFSVHRTHQKHQNVNNFYKINFLLLFVPKIYINGDGMMKKYYYLLIYVFPFLIIGKQMLKIIP